MLMNEKPSVEKSLAILKQQFYASAADGKGPFKSNGEQNYLVLN